MKKPTATVTGEYDCDKGYATPQSITLPSRANANWLKEGDILTFNDVPYRIVSRKPEGASVTLELEEIPASAK